MTHLPVADASWVGSLNGILTGVAELLGIVGAGVGYVMRNRRNNRRERLRTEAAANLAAQEAKRTLESRLEKQHAEQIETYKKQIADLDKRQEAQIEDLARSYDLQIEGLRQQVSDLTKDREALLSRLLRTTERDHD